MFTVPHVETGLKCFAFDQRTDPNKVLLSVAWAFKRGEHLCGCACPTLEGSYCVDCHGVGWAALHEYKKRNDIND
jgi:hypothetical protein